MLVICNPCFNRAIALNGVYASKITNPCVSKLSNSVLLLVLAALGLATLNCIFTHSESISASCSGETIKSRWVLGYGCILFAL